MAQISSQWRIDRCDYAVLTAIQLTCDLSQYEMCYVALYARAYWRNGHSIDRSNVYELRKVAIMGCLLQKVLWIHEPDFYVMRRLICLVHLSEH